MTQQYFDSTTRYFDFVAKDKDDKVILLGKVKAGKLQADAEEQLRDSLALSKGKIPFGIIANSDQIRILKWNAKELSKLVRVFNTGDILHHYEPKFGHKQISDTYLTTLIEAWLRDLAYNWKSKHPPAADEIEEIALLEQLANGTTEEEVEVVLDFVR
jgi:hypothetical protein